MKLHLDTARRDKADEFYTLYKDIEDEMVHYKEYLKDKVVYLPCDEPSSNFYKYFVDSFKDLGLKEVIATSYTGYMYRFDGIERASSIEDGDFLSDECTRIMKQSDIIITNPPFSKFRSFVKWLIDAKKDFIILGNNNACSYKEMFPYLRDGIIKLGSSVNVTKEFIIPEWYEVRNPKNARHIDGQRRLKVQSISWFTTLEPQGVDRHLVLNEKYEEGKYQVYDNYPAINVDRLKDIPIDYDGVIGVPITYWKYHDNGFGQVVGFRKGLDGKDLRINGKDKYARVLIKKEIKKCN